MDNGISGMGENRKNRQVICRIIESLPVNELPLCVEGSIIVLYQQNTTRNVCFREINVGLLDYRTSHGRIR